MKCLVQLRVRQNLGNLSTGSGLGAILLWSATFAFARSLSEKVGPLTAGAAVYLISGCFCLLRLSASSAPLTRFLQLPRLYLLGCGSLFIFYTAAIYVAVGLAKDREQLLEVALVNYLWPALTVLLSLPLLKKRGSVWLAPGTALALTGIFLVMTQGAHVSWVSWRGAFTEQPGRVRSGAGRCHRVGALLQSGPAVVRAGKRRSRGVVPAGNGACPSGLAPPDDGADRLEPSSRWGGNGAGRRHHAGLFPVGRGHA